LSGLGYSWMFAVAYSIYSIRGCYIVYYNTIVLHSVLDVLDANFGI